MNSLKWLFSLLFVMMISFSSHAQQVSGVMMVVKGDIKVTGADGKTEAAKVGKKVSQGDTILAGADSRAKIVMADKNVINVSPDSKIVIEKYQNDGKDNKNVELNVVYGKVRASVEQKYDGEKSKFNVKTPSAVAGVRGTDFMTGYNPSTKSAQIITFAGSVAVGQPGPGGTIKNPVFVQPGQMTTVGAGKPPETPKAVSKEDLSKANNETKADGNSNGQKQDSADKSSNESKKEDKKEDKKDDKKDSSTDKPADKKEPGEKSGDKKDPSTDKPADNGNDKGADKNADRGNDKNGDKRDPASTGADKNEPKSGEQKSPDSNSGRSPASPPPMGGMGPDKLPGPDGAPLIPGGAVGGITAPPLMLPPPTALPPTGLPSTFIGDAIRNTQKSATTIKLAPQ